MITLVFALFIIILFFCHVYYSFIQLAPFFDNITFCHLYYPLIWLHHVILTSFTHFHSKITLGNNTSFILFTISAVVLIFSSHLFSDLCPSLPDLHLILAQFIYKIHTSFTTEFHVSLSISLVFLLLRTLS